MVTGDSQEEVMIFCYRQTDRKNCIIIYISSIQHLFFSLNRFIIFTSWPSTRHRHNIIHCIVMNIGSETGDNRRNLNIIDFALTLNISLAKAVSKSS